MSFGVKHYNFLSAANMILLRSQRRNVFISYVLTEWNNIHKESGSNTALIADTKLQHNATEFYDYSLNLEPV